jgi:hypothetical protein
LRQAGAHFVAATFDEAQRITLELVAT